MHGMEAICNTVYVLLAFFPNLTPLQLLLFGFEMEEYPPDGDVALVISVMEGNIRSPITVVSLVPRPIRLGTRLYCSIVYHRVIGGPGPGEFFFWTYFRLSLWQIHQLRMR